METALVERCLHDRAALAFRAARDAGLPGIFHTFQTSGLLATLASEPGVEFLNCVSGVSAETVEGLAQVFEAWEALGLPLPSVTTTHFDTVVDEHLRHMGYVSAGRRPFAVIYLHHVPDIARANINPDFDVREALSADDRRTFFEILSAGYESPTPLRNFMSAEHSVAEVRRFIGYRAGRPVAAGAMSSHQNVMVLGGAAVLRPARGQGGQRAMLQHRVRAAKAAGCDAVIATAAARSPSLRNLEEAGFEIRLRQAWLSTASP